jgi:SNF family Na+-dependent transporter
MKVTPGDYKWRVRDYLIIVGSLAYVSAAISVMQFVSKVIGVLMLAVPAVLFLFFMSPEKRKELVRKVRESHERTDAWYRKSLRYIVAVLLILFLVEAIWLFAKR